jgi:hypothetical protein
MPRPRRIQPTDNMNRAMELVDRIRSLTDELERAKAELARMLGQDVRRSAPTQTAVREAGRYFKPGSVSQQVLNLVTSAGMGGIERHELQERLRAEPGAIHSALKVHQKAGRIRNADGRWRLAGSTAMVGPVQTT